MNKTLSRSWINHVCPWHCRVDIFIILTTLSSAFKYQTLNLMSLGHTLCSLQPCTTLLAQSYRIMSLSFASDFLSLYILTQLSQFLLILLSIMMMFSVSSSLLLEFLFSSDYSCSRDCCCCVDWMFHILLVAQLTYLAVMLTWIALFYVVFLPILVAWFPGEPHVLVAVCWSSQTAEQLRILG